MLQPKFAEFMGQPIIVESKGGAAGAIGTAEVARAAPDGHVLLIVADPYAVMNHLYEQTPEIFASLEHVVMTTTSPSMLVGSMAFTPGNMKDLVAAAKAGAGVVAYATPGTGTFNHLSALLLEQAAGIQMTHAHPGTNPSADGVKAGKR